MKRIFIVLAALFVAATIPSRAEGLRFVEAESLQEAIDFAAENDLILIVEMYREKCPSCIRLETLIFPSDIVGEALNSNFVCYRINGEEGVGIDIMKKYRGVAFPTLLFFKEGKFIERSVGAGDGPEHFVDRIRSLFSNYDLIW